MAKKVDGDKNGKQDAQGDEEGGKKKRKYVKPDLFIQGSLSLISSNAWATCTD
jgi:hypothetical protein